MAAPFWPDATVSIILLPSGEQGDGLLSLAQHWTELGILSPALWVRPEDVAASTDGPPRILTTIAGLNGDRRLTTLSLDLFEVLAREPLARVRVVKVRSAVPSREIDITQDDIAESVSKYISYSMPMANPNQNVEEQRTHVARVSLVCAPTEFQLNERVRWAADDAGMIIVASPEDRSSPWSGDAFVREDGRFPGFVLMHVATVSGIWNGVTRGTLELFETEASGSRGVWVSRVFVNAVLTDGLARRIAARVLEDAGNVDSWLVDPTTGPPPVGTVVINDERADQYVTAMINGAMGLDDAKLDYRLPPSNAVPGRMRVGFLRQLGLFSKFAVGSLAKIPYWIIRSVRAKANKRLNSELQGDEGQFVVGADLGEQFDARERNVLRSRDNIQVAEAAARAAATSSISASSLRSTPRLWSRLRELVFGSLDGSSDLTDIGFTAIEGDVPIFSHVTDVLPAPENVWRFDGSDRPAGVAESISLRDTSLVVETRSALTQWIAQLSDVAAATQLRVTEVQDSIVAATDRREALTADLLGVGELEYTPEGQPRLLPPSTPSPPASTVASQLEPGPEGEESRDGAVGQQTAAEVAVPGSSTPPPVDLWRKEFAELTVALHGLEARATALAISARQAVGSHDDAVGTLRGLDLWTQSVERSFYWQLVSRMAGAQEKADLDLEAYANEVNALEVPAPGELVRLRKRFHRGLSISWITTILVAALAIFAPIIFPPLLALLPWYPATWSLVFGALGVIAVTMVGILAAYYRGWSAFERSIKVTEARLLYVAEAVQLCRRESQRLVGLHEQAREWLDLLSRAVHHPWRVDPAWLKNDLNELRRDALPFAMQVAQANSDDKQSAMRLKRETSESLLIKGWRANAFTELVEQLGIELGLDGEKIGLSALDSDLPHASNNSRRILRDHLSDDALLEAVARRELRALIGVVQSASIQDARPSVTRIISDPLLELSADFEGIDNKQKSVDWDAFLVGSLVSGQDPVTPLSSLSVAKYELQKGYHQKVSGYLLVPQRLASELAFSGQDLETVPYDDRLARSLEIVLRVDLAGPLPVEAVRLWDWTGAVDEIHRTVDSDPSNLGV